ncbi:MAG: glycoside hydrolase family 3 C-terminal domain-containing protein [Actinomycetota bacterium]
MPLAFERAAAAVAGGDDPHLLAHQLVEGMTLDEKLGCLDGDSPFWPGLIDMSGGGYYRHTWPAAEVASLGVPGIEFADGPRGCVIGDATAFPVSMARGASFDPELEARIGDAIGTELRASGATFTGAVCMNLLRHPGWGRAQETYGEDPHHVGVMAAALTSGLQRHVMACMKHFALNSMENARFRIDVSVDERTLHEVYLPHFRHVAETGVASVMSAYNSVNGRWCGENRMLLTDVLRDEWGWDGFVVSDFIFGLRDPVASVEAGLDIEMPFRQQRATSLPEAVQSGGLDLAYVDRSVQRTVATQLRFASVFRSRPPFAAIGCSAHVELAREASVASIVLLRNSAGVLPVDPTDAPRIAVIGPLAMVPNLGDGGSSDVRTTTTVTLFDGLRASFPDSHIVHVDDPALAASSDLVIVVAGTTKHDEGEYLDAEGTGVVAAELFPPTDDPDVGTSATPVVYDTPPTAAGAASAVPDDGSTGDAPAPNEMAPGGDRRSLRLSESDEARIATAAELPMPTVVVVMGGSAFVMPWAKTVDAIVHSWYPGEQGGIAIGQIIAGEAEPAGRLPFAIPIDESHLTDFDPDAARVTYDYFHGQWKLDRDEVPAHYPFGWGLGYTSIGIVEAALTDDAGVVDVEVRNDGDRDGSIVVFVHAGVSRSAYDRPRRRLVGFVKATVAAGATRSVAVEVDWRQLDVRQAGAWRTEPGEYVLDVGRHADDPDAIGITVQRG